MIDPVIAETFGITEAEYSDWQAVMEIVARYNDGTEAEVILAKVKRYFVDFPCRVSDWKPPEDEQILSWILIASKNRADNQRLMS